MGLEHLNYDSYLEEPYQRKENDAVETEYKLKCLQYDYSIYELIDMLSITEKAELHEIIIEQFEKTLLNAIE